VSRRGCSVRRPGDPKGGGRGRISLALAIYYVVLFCIMSAPRTISFRIPSEKVTALDLIAKAMDRDRSYLLNEAVESYLSEQRRFAAMVEEGLEASRRGELIDDEEVGRMIETWIRDEIREKSPLKKKVLERA